MFVNDMQAYNIDASQLQERRAEFATPDAMRQPVREGTTRSNTDDLTVLKPIPMKES